MTVGIKASVDGLTGEIQVNGTKAADILDKGLGMAQLKFPATQDASSDPNTLDDYEEGTWGAVISSTGGSLGTLSATIPLARYTKIGRMVHVALQINISNAGTFSGTLTVSLPFAPAEYSILNGRELAVVGLQLHGLTDPGGGARLFKYDNSSPVVTGYQLVLSGFYEAS